MDKNTKACSVKGCFNKHYGKGYCKKHYINFTKYGYPVKHFSAKPFDYEINENGCFNCTSHRLNKAGYPIHMIRGEQWLLSRFIYKEMFGDISGGLVVRHKCDNPACINPEHLELGTTADNIKDRVDRGRTAMGSRSGRAKLNEEQVKEIKLSILDGKSNNELSGIYKVDQCTISDIRHGRTWRHVKVG